MAVVGGTASVLGGGKFASGAMAGAFMQMFNAEYDTLRKSLKGLWAKKGEIVSASGRAIVGGAKGLHRLMTTDPSKVKGGIIGQGLFEFSTLKISATSGSHIGYEIVPIENILWTRSFAYTNPLTYDTIYTTIDGEMYTIDPLEK